MESTHPQQKHQENAFSRKFFTKSSAISPRPPQYLYHFFSSPSVRSLSSADYCANPLTQNTTVSAAGTDFPPKESPEENE